MNGKCWQIQFVWVIFRIFCLSFSWKWSEASLPQQGFVIHFLKHSLLIAELVQCLKRHLSPEELQELCPNERAVCVEKALLGECFGTSIKAGVLMKQCKCSCESAHHRRFVFTYFKFIFKFLKLLNSVLCYGRIWTKFFYDRFFSVQIFNFWSEFFYINGLSR